MRPVAAAITTTIVPMLVGQRWIAGSALIRWSLGAVVGIVLAGIGGLLGGLLGSPVAGAITALLVSWFLGARLRWDAGDRPLAPVASRVVIVLVVAGSALIVMSLFRPIPSWDAWFLWSLKAKGLASAGSFDSPVFVSPAYAYSSQDYPTLLPSWQATAYIISGDLSVSWPLQFQQAWLWTASALALMSLTTTSAGWAFLLPLAWVIAPEVVWQSMQGYADVPMALLLVLGAIVLRRNERHPRAHVLAGILLAGAALTKAEGLPLVGIVLICLLLTARPTAVLAIAPATVVVAALPWYIFAQAHGLTNDMINPTIARALLTGDVPFRVPEITVTMGTVMISPLRWGILVPACILTAWLLRAIDGRLSVAALLAFVLFVVVYQATWSFQGSALESFVLSNVHRVLIAPIGLLALSVARVAEEPGTSLPS